MDFQNFYKDKKVENLIIWVGPTGMGTIPHHHSFHIKLKVKIFFFITFFRMIWNLRSNVFYSAVLTAEEAALGGVYMGNCVNRNSNGKSPGIFYRLKKTIYWRVWTVRLLDRFVKLKWVLFLCWNLSQPRSWEGLFGPVGGLEGLSHYIYWTQRKMLFIFFNYKLLSNLDCCS